MDTIKKMSRRITQTKVIQALHDANGILAQAANNLGCSRTTIYNYINKYPKVEKAYEEASETVIDKVESKLMALIKGGNVPSTIFFLKTKGRSRGYTEHSSIALTDPTGKKEYAADARNAILGKLLPELASEDSEGTGE